MSILHVTNGDSARINLQRSGVPGTFIAWPDVLHEGPTPLLSGDAWIQVRTRYLASSGDGPIDEPFDEVLRGYRERDATLESYADYDEVVFWLEHDLFDQLLLIRHLWWLDDKTIGRFSLICGQDYLGMLPPERFPRLFEARRPITGDQIRLGARAWKAFTAEEPRGLLVFAAADDEEHSAADHAELPYLSGAIRRHLQEFPSTMSGLARSERQILQVLSEGLRTPEEAFIEASRLEDHIWMGDASFWSIVRRLADGGRPLVAANVQRRPGHLPSGSLALTADGAAVLSGRADHVALNGIDRWLGGVHLTPSSCWRWTGTTLVKADS
jgi:uncharacterized protein DUF1835